MKKTDARTKTTTVHPNQCRKTHLSRIKERAGNTTEPTENTEEPISITADDTILLYNTGNDTREKQSIFP